MRQKWLVLLLAVSIGFAASPVLAVYEETFTTGRDWKRTMSPREKFISLLPPTLLFSQYDVRLRHSLPEYILLLDHILLRNPGLDTEEVSNIFASAIYWYEPNNREALKNMEISFLSGELEHKPLHAPRLTIEEILREVAP